VLNKVLGWIRARLSDGSRLLVDLAGDRDSYHVFPPDLGVVTTERPDLIVRNDDAKVLLLCELTVPSEDNLEASHRFKRDKYRTLLAELRSRLPDWVVEVLAFETGARGLHENTLSRMLYRMKRLTVIEPFTQSELRDLCLHVSCIALKCSYLIWHTRRSADWPRNTPLMH